MQILTVLTGGTIGSKTHGHVIDVDRQSAYSLPARYIEMYGNGGVRFETIQPLQMLSENMTYSGWSALASCLLSLPLAGYDGIILAHGSDTLSYTAALVSFLLRHTPVPVVLVASNRPLSDQGGNGILNFKNAVDFIRHARLPGVFVSYANSHKEQTIYLASRLRESDPYLDRFSSFGGAVFGVMDNELFVWKKNPYNPTLAQLRKPPKRLLKNPPVFKNPVLCIRPYPNIEYKRFDCTGAKAVLLYLYHSATACTQGNRGTNVLRFIEECQRQAIAVYGASFKKTGESGLYITENALLQAGLRPLYALSIEAAYTKLCLAYNQNEMPPEQIAESNLFYEILP